MKREDKQDPAITHAVETALAPYARLFPAHMVEHLRREGIALLGSHPYPAALAKLTQPPPVVQESGIAPTDGADDKREVPGKRANGAGAKR